MRSWQRAGALFHMFEPGGRLAAPGRIVASRPNAASSSLRPMHTVAPLAARTGLVVRDEWGKGDEETLGEALIAMSGPILIAWHDEDIPDWVRSRVCRGGQLFQLQQEDGTGRVQLCEDAGPRRLRAPRHGREQLSL